MNILVTGATGFIGSYLVKALVKEGHHCRCLARSYDKAKMVFEGLKDIEISIGDVTEPHTLKDITNGIDYIFHLAALSGHDPPSKKAFAKYREVNVKGFANILELCKNNSRLKKIIYTSSTAAFGIAKVKIIDENTEGSPYTPYQVSKYESETLALNYGKKYNVPIVILKLCMVYGPGFTGDLLTMARVAKLGIYPKFGKGKNLAPSLFIDDIINACISAISSGKNGEKYLLGPERSYSQDEIVSTFEKFFGKKIYMAYIPIWLARALAYVEEKVFTLIGRKPIVTARNILSIATDRVLDTSKAKRELGFSQQMPLEKGLLKTLEWFKKERLI